MVTNTPKAARLHPESERQASGLDGFFEITKRHSTVGREIRGGLVTFFAMAYIIALNPLIIGTAADKNGNLVSGAPKFTDAAMTVVDGAGGALGPAVTLGTIDISAPERVWEPDTPSTCRRRPPGSHGCSGR